MNLMIIPQLIMDCYNQLDHLENYLLENRCQG